MSPEKPPKPIPRHRTEDYEPGIVGERRRLCESLAGRALPHLAGTPVPLEAARNKVENLVGYAQVPIGLAGPLLVHGEEESGAVYVPLATTEGALVASYSRGMKLLNAAGGAEARLVAEGYTQNPIFVYETSRSAQQAGETAARLRDELAEITSQGTRHGRLTGLDTSVVGRRLVVRLVFTTGDAVGANMAARAADRCCKRISEATGAERYFLHGQDPEKRASSRHAIEGRGRSVVAEATIPAAVLEEVTRARPRDLMEIQRAYAVGFWQLGTQNWLVQVANGLAALFIACGQDVASVAESSLGVLDFDVTAEGDLHAAVTLPSLMVATVGGGTNQGTAAECLDVLGCRGAGRSKRFAEIVAATVLAGDLSLMAAFCSHELVGAHELLGRNRPDGSRPGKG